MNAMNKVDFHVCDVPKELVSCIERRFDFKEFSRVLRDCGSLLSGGAVVSNVVLKKDNYNGDFDIYTKEDKIKPLQDFLVKKGYVLKHTNDRGQYEGMFQRAKISKRYWYSHENGDTCDVIVTKEDPIETIKMFTLSCCQIWFDGTDKIKYFFKDTFKKIAHVNPVVIPHLDKVISYWQPMNKYSRQGFDIYIMNQKLTAMK